MTSVSQRVHGTDPATHTMGVALGRYVLPKVPAWILEDGRPVEVVAATSILELADGKGSKLFNWRRPSFATVGDAIQCRVTPGTAYVLHYGHLIATAATIRAKMIEVTVAPPTGEDARDFIRRSLPQLPPADAVVVGYVDRLKLGNAADLPWASSPGWSWKLARIGHKRVVLLGCEFSFWGDIAGHVVAELFDRQATDWLLYVGKLGTMNARVRPNRMLATGTESLVNDRPVHWHGRLADDLPDGMGVLRGARHVTVESVVEETMNWFDRYALTHDLVDPEIGHMGAAARDAGATFDYLHLVTDCLAADYGVGLYDERSRKVMSRRTKLAEKASYIIENAIIRK